MGLSWRTSGVSAQDDGVPVTALIIGAGPAGLASAACLKQRGIDALVLEAAPALGQAWRNRYDRLHLHTVKKQSHLPGIPFAKELPRYPARADVVAYLEAYAARLASRPARARRCGACGGRRQWRRIRSRIGRRIGRFVVETARAVYRARAVWWRPASAGSRSRSSADQSAFAVRCCTRRPIATPTRSWDSGSW